MSVDKKNGKMKHERRTMIFIKIGENEVSEITIHSHKKICDTFPNSPDLDPRGPSIVRADIPTVQVNCDFGDEKFRDPVRWKF